MGRRGPAATPTVIAIAKGDPGRRAKRRAKKEPKPPSGNVVCPDWLNEEAKRVWRVVAAHLVEMETAGQRLVSNLDAFALGGFCVAWAKAERAHKELQEHGYTISYTSKSGNEYSQPSPWVAIEKAAWDHVLKFAREFGFTPASRTNIQLSPDKGQKSDLDKDQLKRLFG